jgi:Y_Y_Y domain
MEHAPISHLNVDSILVDGRPIPLVVEGLTLTAASSRLEIAFQPVLLRSQEGLRFRYRLDGFDKSWTYAGASQRLATYTNLSAGRYSFEVKGWEADHPETIARASVAMVKRPFSTARGGS